MAVTAVKGLIAIQLQAYLEEHKLLHPHQGAYRHGRSNDDILLLFWNLTRKILFVVPF